METGVFPGLQSRVCLEQTGAGGFDSHTPPPILSAQARGYNKHRLPTSLSTVVKVLIYLHSCRVLRNSGK